MVYDENKKMQNKTYYQEHKDELKARQREYDRRDDVREKKKDDGAIYRAKKRAELKEKRDNELELNVLKKYNLVPLQGCMVGLGAGACVQCT